MNYVAFFFDTTRNCVLAATETLPGNGIPYYKSRIPKDLITNHNGCNLGIISLPEYRRRIETALQKHPENSDAYTFDVVEINHDDERFAPFLQIWDRIKWNPR